MLAVFTVRAAEPIPLWPKGAPGEKEIAGAEQDTTKASDGKVAGKPVIRLGNITVPTLTVYPAPADKNTGAAFVVCPGGGYRILAMDLEGTEICEWFNSIGVTACLLKYRVPPHEGAERYAAPLQDAQRALSLVRSRAAEWQIDPKRIGILGFSEAGRTPISSVMASTHFDKRTYESADDTDQINCRPDFTDMLIYPAYLVQKEGPALAPEITVPSRMRRRRSSSSKRRTTASTSRMPFTIISPSNRRRFRRRWHLYASGGHGYGLRESDKAVTSWPKRAEEWMRQSGLL